MSLLQELGYTRLAEYPGGMREWLEAGLPVDQDSGQPSPQALLAQLVGPDGSHAPDAGDVVEPVIIPVQVTPPPARSTSHRGASAGGNALWRRALDVLSHPLHAALDLLESLSFGQLFTAWLGMVVAFGFVFYLLNTLHPSLLEMGHPIDSGLRGLAVSLYFSFVCATTIGFGDVVPTGIARGAAMGEAVSALLLFSCVVSKLVSRRQEELTEDIHRITSEHRLGRMQMNLHMVLSELYSVGDLSDARAHGLERLEGITMIFASELRAVHDLLFRPQHLPDVYVLESLLARVANALTELANKLEGLPPGVTCSDPLRTNLRVATRTAIEICGDCVPRAHAPRVKSVMDRVQEQGRRLSSACDAI